jgi:acyl carrier protein
MKKKIKKIMASVFMIDEENIPDSLRQADCELWDSLHHLNLIVALETHFHLSFEPEEILEMTDLDSIARHVEKKLGTRTGTSL